MDGNDSKPQVFVFKKGKSSLKKSPKTIHPEGIRKKRNYKLFAKVAVIVLAAASVYGYFTYNKWLAAPDNQCNGREDSQIYKDASKVMNPEARQKLTAVVGRIKDMKRYDKDPSCLYVLTVYYIGQSEAEGARSSYEKLAIAYNKKKNYVSNLGPDKIKSIEQLEFEVEQVENIKTKRLEEAQRYNKVDYDN